MNQDQPRFTIRGLMILVVAVALLCVVIFPALLFASILIWVK